jgi:pyruvate dehydrogenase E2 component (dihydrolipoamide acetyltransferase)
MSVFAMPSLGADMEDAVLVEWLVAPGDRVARGQVVAVVETQKGAIEIECFAAGTVAELLAGPGERLPVGAPLARMEDAGDAAAPAVVPAPRPPAPELSAPPAASVAPAPVAPAAAPRSGGVVPASPAARALAAEAGIALDGIAGSGPGGAVLLADVAAQARGSPPAPPPEAAPGRAAVGKPGLDMAEMRRVIAAAMSRAKREIPHYYLSHAIDLQAAADWLAAENARREPDRRLLMGALLVRAAVRALAKVPELNGRNEGDAYAPSAAVHCGLAVALRGGGLIAPAILDADRLTLDALMAAMRDLVARCRTGRLRNSELSAGTITVSALGDGGVDALFGVIYPPQVALVGFGTPRPQPMVRDGAVVARLAVTASLAADHRVSDGRRGALYLAEIDRQLQEPAAP